MPSMRPGRGVPAAATSVFLPGTAQTAHVDQRSVGSDSGLSSDTAPFDGVSSAASGSMFSWVPSTGSGSGVLTRPIAALTNLACTPGAISSVTVPSSSTATTVAIMPAVVVTSTPGSTLLRFCSAARCRARAGGTNRRQPTTAISRNGMSPAMPLPPLPPEVAATTDRALLEKGTGRVYGDLCETDLVGVEQRRVGHAGRRRPEAQMAPRRGRRNPTPWRAGEQPAADEKGLGNGLHGLGLLRHGHGERRETHRTAAEAAQQRVEHRPGEPVQAQLVDLVDLERRSRDLPVDDAVSTDLGVVAHASQQPVGDPGRAPSAPGDLFGAVRAQRHLEQRGATHEHLLELGRGVEVEMRDEPEPVAQRSRQQAGARRRADEGERSHVERNGGRAGALADDDIHPEVLHGDVEHLLGRTGHPVDLVEEQHLTLAERGQQRRQIARALDRRPGRDPQRCADLRGEDHRQCRLPESGRAGQQHVVRWTAALLSGRQDEPQLLAHTFLTDELREPLGPQRRLDDGVVAVGVRRHDILFARLRHDVPFFAHARLSNCRLARSNAATSGASPTAIAASASGPTAANASSTSRALQPRPVSAARSCSRHAPTPEAARPTGARTAPVGAPSRSLSSRTSRWAPLRPTPGTKVSAPRSSVVTAARTASGECTESTACASFGPTPLTDWRMSKTTRSSSVAKPKSVSESSRTTIAVASRTDSPARSVARVAGVQWTDRPIPATSTTAVSAPTAATTPVTLAITWRSPCPRRRRPPHPTAVASRRARPGRWRARARRPRPPAEAARTAAAPG